MPRELTTRSREIASRSNTGDQATSGCCHRAPMTASQRGVAAQYLQLLSHYGTLLSHTADANSAFYLRQRYTPKQYGRPSTFRYAVSFALTTEGARNSR